MIRSPHEKQLFHDEQRAADENHDRCSCWCCCDDCLDLADDDDDEWAAGVSIPEPSA